MRWSNKRRKRSVDLSEREILTLAISAADDAARTDAGDAERLAPDFLLTDRCHGRRSAAFIEPRTCAMMVGWERAKADAAGDWPRPYSLTRAAIRAASPGVSRPPSTRRQLRS